LKNHGLKISPDCSGYAICRGDFEALAKIAFERKAGRVFFCCWWFRF